MFTQKEIGHILLALIVLGFSISLAGIIKNGIDYLAILSNHVTEWVWPFLVHNNLNHFFDPILISSEIKLAKPQPEIFDDLLDTIGYSNKPKSCLFIDDKKENIQVAQWLGMQGLQFKGKDNLEEELKKINII